MSDAQHPIPPQAWESIREFLATPRAGRIVLNVKDGRVQGWELHETYRVRKVAQSEVGRYTDDDYPKRG